jgi:hypothetical protein
MCLNQTTLTVEVFPPKKNKEFTRKNKYLYKNNIKKLSIQQKKKIFHNKKNVKNKNFKE